LRPPPETSDFGDLFHYIWNHGLGNALNHNDDPVPWTDDTLEAAFESVHRSVDKRAIQNWRSGRNLPSRRNIHSLCRIVGGDDDALKKLWSDKLIASLMERKKTSLKKSKQVIVTTSSEGVQPNTTAVAKNSLQARRIKRTLVLLPLISLAIIIGLFSINNMGKSTEKPTPSTVELDPVSIEKSIAIFPFKVFSDDPDVQYFSEGITEETLHGLSQVEDIRLASRRAVTSLESRSPSPKQVKAALGVNYILDGSVRSDGSRLKVSIRLIKTSDGSIYWSETFDNNDASIFDIQENISAGIVKALDIHLNQEERQRMFRFGTRDVEAYAHYLKGRHLLKYWHETKEGNDIWRAVQQLEAAVAKDPNMSKAWFHMADAYYHFAAGHIKKPPATLNVTIPDTAADAARHIEFVLSKAEETAKNELNMTQARLNRVFFSDNWSELRDSTLSFSKLASQERGELEWEFGPVSLVILGEGEALRELMDKRALKYDPENGTAHAYVVRQFLSENNFTAAEARLTDARISSFSGRIDEVQGYLFFAKGDMRGLENLLSNSKTLSPLLRDYFSALLSYSTGDIKTARTILETSQALQTEKIHLALAFHHIGDTKNAIEKLEAITSEPLGATLLSVVISYGASCGPLPMPPVIALDQRLRSADINPLPCTTRTP